MFSRENRRFLIIAVALMGVFCTTLVGLVAIYRYGQVNSTPVMATVIGFAGITINQLLAMLRDEQATRSAENSRVVIHEKLNQIAGTPLPKNREELEKLIEEMTGRICKRTIEEFLKIQKGESHEQV